MVERVEVEGVEVEVEEIDHWIRGAGHALDRWLELVEVEVEGHLDALDLDALDLDALDLDAWARRAELLHAALVEVWADWCVEAQASGERVASDFAGRERVEVEVERMGRRIANTLDAAASRFENRARELIARRFRARPLAC